MIKYMLPQKETEFRDVTIERYELYNTETEDKQGRGAKNVFDHIDSPLIAR